MEIPGVRSSIFYFLKGDSRILTLRSRVTQPEMENGVASKAANV